MPTPANSAAHKSVNSRLLGCQPSRVYYYFCGAQFSVSSTFGLPPGAFQPPPTKAVAMVVSWRTTMQSLCPTASPKDADTTGEKPALLSADLASPYFLPVSSGALPAPVRMSDTATAAAAPTVTITGLFTRPPPSGVHAGTDCRCRHLVRPVYSAEFANGPDLAHSVTAGPSEI
jgi:hypothetical protein